MKNVVNIINYYFLNIYSKNLFIINYKYKKLKHNLSIKSIIIEKK